MSTQFVLRCYSMLYANCKRFEYQTDVAYAYVNAPSCIQTLWPNKGLRYGAKVTLSGIVMDGAVLSKL